MGILIWIKLFCRPHIWSLFFFLTIPIFFIVAHFPEVYHNDIFRCLWSLYQQSVWYSKAHSSNYCFLRKSEFQCPKKPPQSATTTFFQKTRAARYVSECQRKTEISSTKQSDMRKQYNSVLSCWTMVCCNCIGLEWCQFFLDFWYFASMASLTTRCFLGLPMEKNGAFEDKKGRSTLPSLCAARK